MSVTQLGPKRFWARAPKSLGEKSLGVYPTREDAADVVARATYAAHQAGNTPAGVTFAAYAKTVLDRREEDGIRAVRSERWRSRRHLETCAFANRPVVDVKPIDIAELARALARKKAADLKGDRKISRKTVHRCLALVRAIFDEAVTDGMRPDNPCVGVKLRRKKDEAADTEEKWDWLRGPEQARFIACADVPEWGKLIVLLAMYTGLRQGELWALKLGDVHHTGDAPHVVVRYGSKGQTTKSGKVRRVPLLGGALDALKAWLKILPTYAPKNPGGLLFPTPTGCHRPIGGLFKTVRIKGTRKTTKLFLLNEWLRVAGVARELRWHDLRHTCASSLVSGTWGRKWTLDEVRDFLGHSSIAVTQIYAHLGDTQLQLAARETLGRYESVTKGSGGGIASAAVTSEDPLLSSTSDQVGQDRLELSANGLRELSQVVQKRADTLRGNAPVTSFARYKVN